MKVSKGAHGGQCSRFFSSVLDRLQWFNIIAMSQTELSNQNFINLRSTAGIFLTLVRVAVLSTCRLQCPLFFLSFLDQSRCSRLTGVAWQEQLLATQERLLRFPRCAQAGRRRAGSVSMSVFQLCEIQYRDTSLTRKRTPLEPYRGPMPGVLGES